MRLTLRLLLPYRAWNEIIYGVVSYRKIPAAVRGVKQVITRLRCAADGGSRPGTADCTDQLSVFRIDKKG